MAKPTIPVSKAPKPIRPISPGGVWIRKLGFEPADYQQAARLDLWTIKQGILFLLNADRVPSPVLGWSGMSDYCGIFEAKEAGKYYEFESKEAGKLYKDYWDIAEIVGASIETGSFPLYEKLAESEAASVDVCFAFLDFKVCPSEFVDWARRKKLSIPVELDALEYLPQEKRLGTPAEPIPKPGQETLPIASDEENITTAEETKESIGLRKAYSIFENLKDVRPNSVAIIILDNDGSGVEGVKVVISGKTYKAVPSDFGLKPNGQGWKLVRGAAMESGQLTGALNRIFGKKSDAERRKKAIKTAISRLNETLKQSMRLTQAPIQYVNSEGYKFAFKLLAHESVHGNTVSKGSDAMTYADSFDDDDESSVGGFWRDS